MDRRWQQGFVDASTTLLAAPWLALKPHEVGVRVFDVMHDILLGEDAGVMNDSRDAAARQKA